MKKTLIGEITVTENLYIKSADYGFLKFTGLDMNDSIEDAVYKDDLPLLSQAKSRLENGAFCAIIRLRGSDNQYFPFLAEIDSITNEEWDQILVHISFADLNSLRENENLLKENRKIINAYFDVLGDILIGYDRDMDEFQMYYVNDARCHYILEGNLNDCINATKPYIVAEYAEEFDELCKNIKSSAKSFRAKLKIQNENLKIEDSGKFKGSLCTIHCKCVDKKVVGCLKLENTDRLKEVNIDIVNDKDAFLDMLNKRAVVEQAERIMARGLKNNYFVLLDLDNFKNVNDTFGHITGDEVLTTFTKIINEKVAGRGIVGRMGGDEILIVTETIGNQTELRNMLRSIRTTVEWTFKNDPRALNVTCSMGVCAFPDYGNDFQTVYSLCDKMLYLAKEKGKNRYIIYTPALHKRLVGDGAEQSESSASKDFTNDKIGVMQKLVDNYLILHSCTNEIMFSEIGEAFELNEILMVYEDFTTAFQWTPNGVQSDIGKIVYFKPKDDFGTLFNKDNLLVLDGLYKLDGRCPDVEKCLKKKDVNSAIFYRINRADKFSGYVMFAKSASRRQSWSEFEIMALSITAKVFDVSMHD